MSGFKVLEGGIYSVIQDLGRYGYMHLGVTHSGAMDEYAYLWGQKLLDNKEANAIEILLGGLKLKATADTTISVCGADLDFRINQEKQEIWRTYQIKKGDILGFYTQVHGLRAYLAVKEGFSVEKIQNSYATTLKEHKGKNLKKNNFLPFHASKTDETRRVPKAYIPTYANTLTLHILLGSQDTFFTEEEKERFFDTVYTLTPQINAMGYKLKGKAIQTSQKGIISEGIAFGAVQIPPDGQPIILLKERQTIGGYPKIGTVLASDCFALAQLPIGAKVRFKEIDIEKAEKILKQFYSLFQ